jgi:hypothetical protein
VREVVHEIAVEVHEQSEGRDDENVDVPSVAVDGAPTLTKSSARVIESVKVM